MPEYGLNIGSRRSVNVITPTFDRDFVTFGTLNHGIGPDITFTRASSATVFTSTGILSTVPNNVPRFEWGSFRTNYIRNSTMAGAVVGNPGTVPTNWNSLFSNVTGVSAEIVGLGTTSGFNYIDIKLSGQAGATAAQPQYAVNFETTTAISAVSGQTWTGSVYAALVGGDLTGFNNIQIDVVERSSTGTYLIGTQTNIHPTINSTLQRYSSTRLFNQPTVGRTSHRVVASLIDGQNLNATLRVAAPQLELSSVATAFIPTTNAPVTTGVPLGFLIEEARTNLVGEQNLFNWADLGGASPLSAGTGIAGLSSFILNDTSDTVFHQRNYIFPSPLLSSTTYCFSCYVKKNTLYDNFNPLLRIRYSDLITSPNQGFAGIYVNQATGAATVTYTSTTSAVSVQDFGTYFRSSFTFNSQTTGQPIRVDILPCSTSAALTGTTIEVAGIQVEQGSFPTSYIPTAGLSATRAVDSAIVTPINSFYNQEQGTLLTEAEVDIWSSLGRGSAVFDNTTGENRTFLYTQPNGIASSSVFNGSQNLFSALTPALPGAIFRHAIAFRSINDWQYAARGILTTSINNQLINTNYTHFRLGRVAYTDSSMLNGYLRKVTYWPSRLSNNRLRTLTLSA